MPPANGPGVGGHVRDRWGDGAGIPPGMAVLGIVGRSGSGKTTLIESLLPALRAAGLRVSTIKHSHHGVDLDPPGKDSRRHREAGAEEVLLATADRWTLLREEPDGLPPLPRLLARMTPVDLVLVEGFGRYPIPRLEVVRTGIRAGRNKRPLCLDDASILAVAADEPFQGWPGPWLPLAQPDRICGWIVALARGAGGT
ncbi:molybdopterin-guanine dinucleotide biosynthesis protein B [Rhizosaccharibacter radicis]|uniref:Molybdopterin-guanine dinucleotide biosynthesis protein B n=1 Tax=Rhizosaccharibacter radicis TaxID=2782605 RepID=A0ABT1VX03_9PROT|nr:molybdopterin-guanine dinucleotide biosynthesis protein B [Acetobacteraceae bacterium KSS12]